MQWSGKSVVRTAIGICALAGLLGLAGCVGQPLEPVKAYDGPELPDDELATLRTPWNAIRSIRRIDLEGKDLPPKITLPLEEPGCCPVIKLQPGYYAFFGESGQSISPLLGGGYVKHSIHLNFFAKAGHIYLLNRSYTGVGSSLYYIEDLTACGEVVAGRRTHTPYGDTLSYPAGCTPSDIDVADEEKARAEFGDPQAQLDLAMRTGQTPEEKRKWLCLAAVQGHGDAAAQLGLMYLLGLDPADKDLIESYRWYALAEANGHAMASSSLDRLRGLMTPEDFEKAQSLTNNRDPGTCDF